MICPICSGDPGYNCIHGQEEMFEHTAKMEGITIEEMYERAFGPAKAVVLDSSKCCSICSTQHHPEALCPTCNPSPF